MRIRGEKSAHLFEEIIILIYGLAAAKIVDTFLEILQHPFDRVSFEGFPIAVKPPNAFPGIFFPGDDPVITDLFEIHLAQQIEGTMLQHGSRVQQFSDGRFAGADGTN